MSRHDHETHDGGGQGVRIDRRKAVIGVVLAVLLAGGAFTVIGQVAQFGRISTALSRAEKVWLPLCLIGELLAYIGYFLAYRDTAKADGGPAFSLRTVATIVVFGSGTSIIGASVSGLAVAFWAIRRSGSRLHTASRRAIALGTIEWTVLSVYGLLAAVVVLLSGERAPLAMIVPWLVVIPACVLGARWFTSPKRVHRFIDLPTPAAEGEERAGPLPARIASWLWEKVQAGFADALAGVVLVRHLFAHPIRYHGGALGYPIYWAGDMLTLYFALRAFGAHVPIPAMALAYATSNIITLFPLPAGGAGGIDAGMTFALRAIGVPLVPALLAVLVYRIITFWLPTLPALALLPRMRRLNETLPRVRHTEPDTDEEVSFRPAAGRAA